MGKRKTRNPCTEKGQYIQHLDIRIRMIDAMLSDAEKERKSLEKMLYKPVQSEMPGIDYEKEKISTSKNLYAFIDAVSRIDAINANIYKMQKELVELTAQKNRVLNYLQENKEPMAQVFYLREVVGLTQEQTAVKMGYSTRQIQRIEKKIVSESDTSKERTTNERRKQQSGRISRPNSGNRNIPCNERMEKEE